ncbi:MAG: PD-(D/E)XK nuclease family protein, partial [Opitutaceae bacterium]|nr:PD-(D/E)XK nuclease family protein [Opitutaceae bacterium]
LPSGRKLPVFGRADLVLSDRRPEARDDYAHARLWIVDFKTGGIRPLRAERLRAGEGVQLPLYGLAFAALGAAEADLSILKPGDPLVRQLSLREVRAEASALELFAWMLETGTFGRLEPIRPEFGAGPEFPIACLETGTDLKAKWQAGLSRAPLPSVT